MSKTTKPVLFKLPKTKTATKPKTLTVGFDIFGNAVPESAQVEGTGKSLRVVRKQEVAVKPSRKNKPKTTTSKKKSTATALVPVAPPSLLGRLVPSWFKPSAAKATEMGKVSSIRIPAKQDHAHHDGISERLEYAFKRLHQEFNQREQQLEDKIQELKHHHVALQSTRKQRYKWLVPVAVAGFSVIGYALYILTSMQGSMLSMSGNINTMNTHMGTMAGDTQTMTQNIQSMNESMYYMNNNVAYMSGNVAQMNQKVGTLAQAAAPMGEAASTVSPFMKMFKSFMPF
jgi:prefoldin subunit 5